MPRVYVTSVKKSLVSGPALRARTLARVHCVATLAARNAAISSANVEAGASFATVTSARPTPLRTAHGLGDIDARAIDGDARGVELDEAGGRARCCAAQGCSSTAG